MDKTYIDVAIELLQKLKTQEEAIQKAASLVAKTIEENGLIHVFGTGHSHMIVEEAYARAGGLIPVDPILEPSLMLHEGYGKSSALERLSGLAKIILDSRPSGVKENDVAIIVSNSGRNAAPIEMAMLFKEKNVPVIAITSLSHSRQVTSRHSSGKKLYEVADVVLDNMGEPGDAALEIHGLPVKVCPTSTISGAALLWEVLGRAVAIAVSHNATPPVIVSGNLDKGEEWNRKVFAQVPDKYQNRLPWFIRAN